jgi:L-iditol 2-dehydrogenase
MGRLIRSNRFAPVRNVEEPGKLPMTKHRVLYLIGPERLELRELELPRPGDGEIVVRIDAATTCGTDVKVYRRGGHPRMLVVPAPFGHEIAGTVAQLGKTVRSVSVGDRVVVANSASCGHCRACSRQRENLCEHLVYLNGAYAESILVPEAFVRRSLWPIPDALPSEIAALAEPLACVLHGIEVLPSGIEGQAIVWGSGPIGLLFVGALRERGLEVVVADPNPARLDRARRLGARQTVPIERGGGAARSVVEAAGAGAGFDVSVDATGIPTVWTDAVDSARPGGAVSLFGGCAPGTRVDLDTHHVHYGELSIHGAYHHRPSNFRRAIELLANSAFEARVLLDGDVGLEGVEHALKAMIRKEALKFAVRPHGSSR